MAYTKMKWKVYYCINCVRKWRLQWHRVSECSEWFKSYQFSETPRFYSATNKDHNGLNLRFEPMIIGFFTAWGRNSVQRIACGFKMALPPMAVQNAFNSRYYVIIRNGFWLELTSCLEQIKVCRESPFRRIGLVLEEFKATWVNCRECNDWCVHWRIVLMEKYNHHNKAPFIVWSFGRGHNLSGW